LFLLQLSGYEATTKKQKAFYTAGKPSL